MTIDELLEAAQRSLEYADPPETNITPMQIGICSMYSQYAQAAAAIAQAMILRNSTACYDDPSAAIKVDAGN